VIAGTPDECRDRLLAYDGLVEELLLLNVLPAMGDDACAAYGELFNLIRTLNAGLPAA
jgi:hypothetical protein